MKKLKEALKRLTLPIFCTITFTLISLLSVALVVCVIFFLVRHGIVTERSVKQATAVVFVLVCILSGMVITFVLSCVVLCPIHKYMAAFDKISQGDYSVRIEPKGMKIYRRFSERFNHMVSELDSVETLSNSFVNNFSHEFKTPIVSIQGFARILKREDITTAERQEYLDVIISESQRLTDLSSNVLFLSKIEQQSAITEAGTVNLSEQIRLVISLMDSKWHPKRIEFSLNDEDVYLRGNEKLLEQIWINVIDNAVKFSPDGGRVEVECKRRPAAVLVTVTNQSPELPEMATKHMFDKFYQGDESHASQGNGLGLSIAQRVAELHGGNIYARWQDNKVTVSVILSDTQPRDRKKEK